MVWTRDGKGFFYTRYPRSGERPKEDESFYQQLYFHTLGTDSSSDCYELGKELPRVAEIGVDLDPGSGRVLATVQKGDGGQFAHYLRDVTLLRTLVERGYTHPERLGIIGGSNGGLLMGATLTQHPELVRAVVSCVGIYDSLREELLSNGEFNVEEFGTVKDPEQFKALHAYSPYHHVESQRRYPATFLLTGENDPRVEPMQTRKMTAQLQAASAGSGTHPVPRRVGFWSRQRHAAGAQDPRADRRVCVHAQPARRAVSHALAPLRYFGAAFCSIDSSSPGVRRLSNSARRSLPSAPTYTSLLWPCTASRICCAVRSAG